MEISLEKRVGAFEEKTMMCHKTLPKLKTYLKQCVIHLTKVQVDYDLASIRDDMIGEIRQFLYLVEMQ
jgi:hypothetical protein